MLGEFAFCLESSIVKVLFHQRLKIFLALIFDDGRCRILTKLCRCDVEALYSTAPIDTLFGNGACFVLCMNLLSLHNERSHLQALVQLGYPLLRDDVERKGKW